MARVQPRLPLPNGPNNKDGSHVAAPAQADSKGEAKGKGKGDSPCFRESDTADGKCDRANCPYKHIATALASPPARRSAVPAKSRSLSPKPVGAKPVCHFFQKGRCKYGKPCTHAHHRSDSRSLSPGGSHFRSRSPSGRIRTGSSPRPKGRERGRAKAKS